MPAPNDPVELVRAHVLSEQFVRAVFSGVQLGLVLPWQKVQIRPVQVKGQRMLQFSYFDHQKDISKNYAGDEVSERLEELIAARFRNTHLIDGSDQIQINISSKGRPVVGRTRVDHQPIQLTHNRRKQYLLPEGQPDPFLAAVGIMGGDGAIRPSMYDKYRQINEFLKIIDQTIREQVDASVPLTIVDYGCGNAYLSFAAYHYLTGVLQLPVRLIGIDRKADLVQRNRRLAEQLGWENVEFHVGQIIDQLPVERADMAIALHACDTATDEALVQAVRLQSRWIFSAPCCHHQLQAQLARLATPAPFQPLMRHGILSERMGDLLTDTFRATLLRLLGYRADVIQFVDSEHTARNLMIRAVSGLPHGEMRVRDEYLALKQFWQVTPHMETLLSADEQALVEGTAAHG